MILDRIPANSWALLCVVLLFVASHQRSEALKARADQATYRAQVAEAQAIAIAHARETENTLRGQAEKLRTALEKETQHAQDAQARLVAGIRAGTQRLSIAASCPTPGGQAGADSAIATGTADTPRAELDPQAAETLVGIAADGDAAIIERNACVEQYNAVREALND